ncbi:hypothetical protein T10_73, partial [Trichinella papuae]
LFNDGSFPQMLPLPMLILTILIQLSLVGKMHATKLFGDVKIRPISRDITSEAYVSNSNSRYGIRRGQGSEFRQTSRQTFAQCYSCASYELRAYWYHLQAWYNTPKNFTDRCVTMDRRDCQHIALESCPSQCITLRQQKTIAGHTVGYHVIRGCLTSLFRWNILDTSQISASLMKPRDFCYNLRLSQILPSYGSGVKGESDQLVRLCVCHGDRCNSTSKLINSHFIIFCLLTTLAIVNHNI